MLPSSTLSGIRTLGNRGILGNARAVFSAGTVPSALIQELSQIISQIEPVDHDWLDRAQERLDFLTKPPGNLSRLV